MKKLIGIIAFIHWSCLSFSQTIRVLDKSSQLPVYQAIATWTESEKKSTSGADGKFFLQDASFLPAQTVEIQAEGYLVAKIAWTPVANIDVELSPDLTAYILPVVITANRLGKSTGQSLSVVSVLERESIDRLSPRSAADALLGVAGVWMQRTNHGGGSPFIRGLSGNQVLLLVDGIRVNNSTFRYGPNQYFNVLDPLNIQQVEVVRGQTSVEYGTDALGGVINVLSRQPLFAQEGKSGFQGGVYGKAMSQDMELSTRVVGAYQGERIAIRAGTSWKDFGDVRAGGNLGFQRPSGYQEQSGDLKVRLKLADNHQLSASWMMVNQEHVGRYDQVAQRGYSRWEFDPQRWQQAYLRYEGNTSNCLLFWKATLSGIQSIEQRKSQKIGSPEVIVEADSVHTLAILGAVTWKPIAQVEIAFGVEYYGDIITSGRLQQDEDTGISIRSRGLYPTGSIAWNSGVYQTAGYTLGHLRIEGGWRYNWFAINIPDQTFGEVQISPDALVGHVGLTFDLGKGHALYSAARTGFRAPNVNDMSTFGPFDSGYEVPAYDLNPEKTRSVELGYRFNRRRGMLFLSGYYTQLTDLMVRQPFTYNGSGTYLGDPVFGKVNTGKAFITGLEAEGAVRFAETIELKGFLIYTYGQDISANEPLRRIPPLNGRIALRKWWGNRLWIEGEMLAASAQNRLSGGDKSDHRINPNGTPAWAVANLRAGTSWKFVSLSAGLQNITNTAYRYHGSGTDMLGRSLYVSLRLGAI